MVLFDERYLRHLFTIFVSRTFWRYAVNFSKRWWYYYHNDTDELISLSIDTDGSYLYFVLEGGTMNPENKCAHLFMQSTKKLEDPLREMFEMQLSLQKRLASEGKGVDYSNAEFKACVDDITVQWRNLTTEFTELLERLPFKEWKNYTDEQKKDFLNSDHRLEVWYEYADMFHFFMNIGLALGINGDTLEHLYVTKNKENFDRQDRGY